MAVACGGAASCWQNLPLTCLLPSLLPPNSLPPEWPAGLRVSTRAGLGGASAAPPLCMPACQSSSTSTSCHAGSRHLLIRVCRVPPAILQAVRVAARQARRPQAHRPALHLPLPRLDWPGEGRCLPHCVASVQLLTLGAPGASDGTDACRVCHPKACPALFLPLFSGEASLRPCPSCHPTIPWGGACFSYGAHVSCHCGPVQSSSSLSVDHMLIPRQTHLLSRTNPTLLPHLLGTAPSAPAASSHFCLVLAFHFQQALTIMEGAPCWLVSFMVAHVYLKPRNRTCLSCHSAQPVRVCLS